ncbi:hypothetical protein GQ54DRAFT_341420 [Martensiomyces pterosporus]|nr:hypothetical protein GQ54DRAFT_341420 [Martensiomyces pterosporus]
MATATGESSKADKAKLIAEWANNGLGFRKESTLVSSRGNEKLEEADVVPLLQGDLATLLELASTHIVSSQQASLQRMRLAAYSTQHVADKAGKQFAYTSLRSTVSDMAAKKQQLESEIGEAEHETHAALQKINELESRLGAAEERVRHSRLQVFIKQAMAENLRRLSRRMKALIQEMTDNASVAQTSICRRLVDELPAHDGRGGFGGGTPMEVLSTLVEDTGRASLELLEQAKKCQDSRANEAYEMRRTMVANLIVSLKELQDRYVALWSSVSGLESQLAAEKHTLENKLEHVSGQLNIKALSNSGQPHDYNCFSF